MAISAFEAPIVTEGSLTLPAGRDDSSRLEKIQFERSKTSIFILRYFPLGVVGNRLNLALVVDVFIFTS